MNETVRSLSFGLDWDLDIDTLRKANDETDDWKSNLESVQSNIKTLEKTSKRSSKSFQSDNAATADSAENIADEVSKIGKNTIDATEEASNLSKAFNVAKKAIVGGAVVAAITKITKEFANAGAAQQEYFRIIQVGTGATGEALDNLMSSFEYIGSKVPNDLNEVANAISNVNTLFDYEGKALENFTERVLQLGTITGESVDGVTESVAALSKQWGLNEEQTLSSLDALFSVSQSTGVGINELANSTSKYAVQLKTLGYELDESILMIGQWEKAGLDSNSMLAGLNIATKKFVNDGVKDIGAAYNDLIFSIATATTEVEAQALALEYFGRDGVRFADTIRSGTFTVNEFTDSLMNVDGAIEAAFAGTLTFGEQLDILKNQLHFTMAEAGLDILGLLGDLLVDLTPLIVTVVSKVGSLISVVVRLASAILPPLVDIVVQVFDVLSPVIDAVIEIIDFLIPPLISVINLLISSLQPLFIILRRALETVIKPIIKWVGNLIGIFTSLINFISDVFLANWSSAWEKIGSVFDTIVSGFAGIFIKPINIIIDAINLVLGGFNKIKIPDKIPIVGGIGFNFPTLDKFEYGTDFAPGGLSLVGERGPELLELPRGSSVKSTRQTENFFDKASQTTAGGNVFNIPIEVHIEADGLDASDISKLEERLISRLPAIIEAKIEEIFKKYFLKNKPPKIA